MYFNSLGTQIPTHCRVLTATRMTRECACVPSVLRSDPSRQASFDRLLVFPLHLSTGHKYDCRLRIHPRETFAEPLVHSYTHVHTFDA